MEETKEAEGTHIMHNTSDSTQRSGTNWKSLELIMWLLYHLFFHIRAVFVAIIAFWFLSVRWINIFLNEVHFCNLNKTMFNVHLIKQAILKEVRQFHLTMSIKTNNKCSYVS